MKERCAFIPCRRLLINSWFQAIILCRAVKSLYIANPAIDNGYIAMEKKVAGVNALTLLPTE